MPSVRFEPTISAGERPQTYALDLAATGTGARTKYYRTKYVTYSQAAKPVSSLNTKEMRNQL